MTTPQPPLEHAKRIAGYEILSKLGQGGMGAVYKARQLSLDRMVALKVLPKQLTDQSDFISRFGREARVTGRLNHPHIIKVFDVGRSQTGICYYAMEFVEGENLRAILEREGRLSAPRVFRILEEMAGALEHAHRHGVIHRDIKPDNILIDMEGSVKLADLGLAKMEDATRSDAGFASLSGTVVGTPYYMSPEQAEGRAVDTRSDLYSLGATAYHLMAGAPPFEADTPMGVITKHLTEKLPALRSRAPETPPALEAVIHRLMAKKPEARFQTPADLHAELQRVKPAVAGGPGTARPDPPPKRGPLIAAGAGLAAVLLLGLGVALRSRPASAPAPPPPALPDREQEAREALRAVADYRRVHPQDYEACALRLERLAGDFAGTRAAGDAGRQLLDLRALIEAARRPEPEKPVPVPVSIPAPAQPPPMLAAAPPAVLAPPRPVETVPENLKEAGRLLDGRPDAQGLARLRALLAAPPADPRQAVLFNQLYRRMLQAQGRQALDRLAALHQDRDWEALIAEAGALRQGLSPLHDHLDPAGMDRFSRMEKQAIRNRDLGSWRCRFPADGREWKRARPWGDRPLTGAVQESEASLRIGAAKPGDSRCSVEAQGPLVGIHPGAVLAIKARLVLSNPRQARPPPGEIAYFCLRDEKGGLIPFDRRQAPPRLRPGERKPPFARQEGFLDARALGVAAVWGAAAPREIPLDLQAVLDPARLPFGGKESLQARLCAGLSLEQAPSRSAVLILDAIDIFYEEEP